ncbi:TetR/AcrR family transcriptional regulator [Myxococcus sp. CA051A]|nr:MULTISPECIES: TetR/AcrR family transcriptional regulator [unclassified Myxococcus]NTX08321.1 TetR/AcrR family transcriptional regulator [Myxococcus sp. CA040A]NTX14723.1 TetR/AcrR family transcriptional regulator [Myxococcus sp. CA056]NTX40368.1 TetR/AcrR family transcriptional regulator [Myxococcus sp. CA033]NTX57979.1 TetR/AcrR family transcriptional regulator [Myxococcus sp. CA039A]NTX67076.1 TetR/AcrR family transcriptional regulator [Myxococcus sp. CA051A]
MGPARRDGVKRRDALLDAALHCFAERGVLSTGIEEIRKAAGASPSSVYHLFDGLPDLTLALLIRTFERLFTHLSERVLPTTTAEAAVVALVDGHLEWIFAHRDEGRFMYQAMAMELGTHAAGALTARKAELLAPIVQHFGRFIAEGSLPPWPPLLLDVVLLGPSHEACRRFLAGAPLEPSWMRGQLPRLAWQSVKSREAHGS